jgi:hypothetical protein
MKFRRKVCANLWMTVEKRRAERLQVHGAKGKKGLFPIGRREHGRHTKEKQIGNRKERGCCRRG